MPSKSSDQTMIDLILDPGNEDRIDRVYVFMSIDDEGRNGIVAMGTARLVIGSLHAAEIVKKFAQEVADQTGKPVGMFAFRRETQLWQTK
jgi:hypothetical protein